MQPTEQEERIILSLAHFRPGDFQAVQNLLVSGPRRTGQGRLGLMAWSQFRPPILRRVLSRRCSQLESYVLGDSPYISAWAGSVSLALRTALLRCDAIPTIDYVIAIFSCSKTLSFSCDELRVKEPF
jgi:hypothetical protein